MRAFLLPLALLSTAASAAVPLELTHQGRLFDAAGDPLTGAHDLSIALYDAPAGGAKAWSEDLAGVSFEQGYYAVDLGQTTPFDLGLLQGAGALWVALTVDGGVELPQRLPLQSVPFAFIAARADVATSVSGGAVDATSLTVNGTSVVAEDGTIAWDRITGAPAQLGDLGCAQAGQIPQWSGSAWGCVNPDAHSHSADQLTSGTLSLDVIPIGTSQNTVARGDHTHTALDLDLGPNAIDNPLNHDRYTDAEARAAVGPHTPAYTDDMARAAVGDHTVDTTLSDAEVDAFVTNGKLDLAAGTTVGGAAVVALPTGTQLFRGAAPLMLGPVTVVGDGAGSWVRISNVGICTNCITQVGKLPNSAREYRLRALYTDSINLCGAGATWRIARHTDPNAVYVEWTSARTYSGSGLDHSANSPWFTAADIAGCTASWTGTCAIYLQVPASCPSVPVTARSVDLEYYDTIQ